MAPSGDKEPAISGLIFAKTRLGPDLVFLAEYPAGLDYPTCLAGYSALSAGYPAKPYSNPQLTLTPNSWSMSGLIMTALWVKSILTIAKPLPSPCNFSQCGIRLALMQSPNLTYDNLLQSKFHGTGGRGVEDLT